MGINLKAKTADRNNPGKILIHEFKYISQNLNQQFWQKHPFLVVLMTKNIPYDMFIALCYFHDAWKQNIRLKRVCLQGESCRYM